MRLLVTILFFTASAFSQSLDIEQFYSSEEASVTKLTLSKDFGKVALWGFVESFIDDEEYANFSEWRLTTKINNHVAVQVEHDDILGSDNDVLRFGMVLSTEIKDGWAVLRLFPYETGNEQYQTSVIWYYPFGDVFFTGFLDLDIYQDNELVVFEPAIGYRLEGNWSIICRYTYNDYTSEIVRDENSVTIGFAYAISEVNQLLRSRLFRSR